ncbi:MAG: thioredoxin [Planctomycetaceae bacterium]|nr:thioredoxin [Planctomycetaceae bacterium]
MQIAVAAPGEAAPTVDQAIGLKPVQQGIGYNTPLGEQVKKCKIEAAKSGGSGWVIRGESGQLLRRFLDTNNDNKLDQWSYYKDGLEVYRDVDANFNGKADQYRWLGTGGSRWGLDRDEDGSIDSWKVISPEEAAAEVIAALSTKDAKRFQRLLLSTEELKALGVGKTLEKDLRERLATTRRDFDSLLKTQKMVASNAKWLQFGATRPGIIPAGTDGATADLLAYDHAAAIIETDGKHGQVSIGTLVRVSDSWRIVDLPKSESSAGFFYASIERAPDVVEGSSGNINAGLQKLLDELEKIDEQSAATTSTATLATLNRSRADVLEKIAAQATKLEDRMNWVRQFADTVSAAVQSGEYPKGIQRLESMMSKLAKDKDASSLVPYVKFHHMTAEYGQKLQKPNADFVKIQGQWVKDLEAFVKAYPKSESTPDVILQLAMANEFSGKESSASKWYSKIISDFASSAIATKAAGAKRRLESVGRSIELRGKTVDGLSIDLAEHRGKVVLIHYWATWCQPCKEDLKTIKALQAKYASKGFAPIGINLDNDQQALKDYLRATALSWPQLYEEGGLDSRLANELGVLTLPTMLLIDKSGRVVRRNIHSTELETEIAKLTK